MVVRFLNNSETNQLHKVVPKQKINRPIVINRPHESYACDITFLKEITLDKNEQTKEYLKESQAVLTLIDQFSRFAFAWILPNKQAIHVAQKIETILRVNPPKIMRTDNGSEFKANIFKKLMEKYKIKHKY